MNADDEVTDALSNRLEAHRNDPRRFEILAGLADDSGTGLPLGRRLLGAGLALAVAAAVTVLAINTGDDQLVETARPPSTPISSAQSATSSSTELPVTTETSPSLTSGTDADPSDSSLSTETTSSQDAATSQTTATTGATTTSDSGSTTATSGIDACDLEQLLPAGVIDTKLTVGDSTLVLDKLPGGEVAVLDGGEGSIDFRMVLVHHQTCEAVVAASGDGDQTEFTLTARPDKAATFSCSPTTGGLSLVQTTLTQDQGEWSGESLEVLLDAAGLVVEVEAPPQVGPVGPGPLLNCGEVLLSGIWS